MKKSSKVFHSDGLSLHAAAVLSSKGVILFLGHSGSGKTTISRLLSDHFRVLKNDRVFLQATENNIWIVATECACQTKKSVNKEVNQQSLSGNRVYYPLHSIVRVFGAQKSELIPLTPIKTCEYLMDAVFEIDHQRGARSVELEQQWFKKTVQIARRYPGWLLQFSLQKFDILRQLNKMDLSLTSGTEFNKNGEISHEKEN